MTHHFINERAMFVRARIMLKISLILVFTAMICLNLHYIRSAFIYLFY